MVIATTITIIIPVTITIIIRREDQAHRIRQTIIITITPIIITIIPPTIPPIIVITITEGEGEPVPVPTAITAIMVTTVIPGIQGIAEGPMKTTGTT